MARWYENPVVETVEFQTWSCVHLFLLPRTTRESICEMQASASLERSQLQQQQFDFEKRKFEIQIEEARLQRESEREERRAQQEKQQQEVEDRRTEREEERARTAALLEVLKTLAASNSPVKSGRQAKDRHAAQ